MRKLFLTIVLFATLFVPVKAYSQSWTTSPQTPSYPVDIAPYPPGPVIGDGSNDWGGVPPAIANEPADIPTTVSLTGWITGSGVVFDTTPAEAKFRTTCNATKVGHFDPIRGLGRQFYGHLHEFFGNNNIAHNSSYTSLRTDQAGGSTCGGGPLNLTGYWFPAPLKSNAMGDGITRVKRANFITVYYNNQLADAEKTTRIPRGLRYIAGVNMDDPDDLVVKAEIAAANVAALSGGGAGVYQYVGNGWGGWFCTDTGANAKFLANLDGSDALGNCPTSSRIHASLAAPSCWDGHNLSSPDGYRHLRYMIRNNNSGRANICPTGWFQLPRLQILVNFSHQGAADYTTWRLSSDDAAAAASGHAMRNGESFHTDWFGAWDYPTMLKWMEDCNGVEGNTPAECDYSTIGAAERMISDGTAPDGSRNPQVVINSNFDGDQEADWFTIPVLTGKGRLKLRTRM